MGIFDRRKERDKEKSESPEWLRAYVPSYTYLSDKNSNPYPAFVLNEDISTRLLKKPQEDYENVDNFRLVLASSTEKKIIGEVPYDKAIKVLEKFQIDETKEELLVRAMTNDELKEVIDLCK